MSSLINLYFGFLKVLIAACLLVMVVLVFGNVVLRYGFNSGITVSEELSRWLFIWMTFLGSIVALRDHGHLGVDSLVRRLPPMGKRVCVATSQALMLYGTWLLLEGSWQQTLINLDVVAPASGFSNGWFYGVGVVFGVSTLPMLAISLFRTVTGLASEDELVIVRESEEAVSVEEVRHLPVAMDYPVGSQMQGKGNAQ